MGKCSETFNVIALGSRCVMTLHQFGRSVIGFICMNHLSYKHYLHNSAKENVIREIMMTRKGYLV